MRRRQLKPPPCPTQLELELRPPSQPPRPPGLWEQVEALPAKVAKLQRQRRKVLKPKLRQADLLGADVERPG